MPSGPLVSILIPCYNAARWLAATLESALAQTWAHREIIVVDDGSHDDSLAIARGFTRDGVIVQSQANRGAAAARNTALRAARGGYLQFLDADDLLAPDKIARQMERLRTAPAGSVASAAWARFFDDDPSSAVFVEEPAWRDFPNPADFFVLHYNEGWMMMPAAWLVPRGVADAAGLWDERLSLNDDGEYFCRVAMASAGIVFTPTARCFYRSGNPGSLSDRKDPVALRSLQLSFELNEATLLSRTSDDVTRRALANMWQKFAYDAYPDLPAQSAQAARRAREFGGATRPWEAGARLKLLSTFIGWRGAKRVQRMFQRPGSR